MITHPESARRIVFPAKGRVALRAFELGALQAGQLRVRTDYSLMSIGTETTVLHQRYAPDSHFARMFSFPQLQTGVQAIGEVEAVHASVTGFLPGDRVFMRLAHGSHQVLPASQCSPVPAGIDPKLACWCGLAKTAFRAAWAGRFGAGVHVLIIGAGPVGQMATRWAVAMGCDSVGVADVSPFRLGRAQTAGVRDCYEGDINSVLGRVAQIDEGRGPGIVIDSTGNPEVFQSALAAAAPFGKVILLGDTGYPSRQCLSSQMMTKGLTVQATHDSHDRDGWDERRVDRHFFETVLQRQFNLSGLITNEFSPEDCVQAYDLAETARDNIMGVLFDWTTAE